jgi:tetraacyldisaccharide 4'-kinase
MNWLWYKANLFSYLLTPLSAIYKTIITLRRWSYVLGLQKTTYFPVPVIVVGNISVGGTGKTPLVIWLSELLQQQGYQPGIVSRGYGGKAKHYPQWVTKDSDAEQVGDEPLLMAQRTNCPVVVDPNRVAAVNTLLANSACNIIISDDGLQHYALGRNIEIAVIDGERRFGNRFCLPAGPLREPISRLDKVDFKLTQGEAQQGEFAMQLIPSKIYNIAQPELLLPFNNIAQPIHAVAAIGNPSRFFQQLRLLGLNIIEHPFPDHYYFKAVDLDFADDKLIIMTEKDAVKCKKFADKRYWCLAVNLECDENFKAIFLQKLKLLGF